MTRSSIELLNYIFVFVFNMYIICLRIYVFNTCIRIQYDENDGGTSSQDVRSVKTRCGKLPQTGTDLDSECKNIHKYSTKILRNKLKELKKCVHIKSSLIMSPIFPPYILCSTGPMEES